MTPFIHPLTPQRHLHPSHHIFPLFLPHLPSTPNPHLFANPPGLPNLLPTSKITKLTMLPLLSPSAPSPITSGTRYPITRYVSHSNFSEHHRIFANNISQLVEPNTYEEARHNPRWVKAMNFEITALDRPIGCKCIFKIKYNSDSSIERYKAPLVPKGFTQREGIDYTETFAPVA
ncbi:hypothetical protein L3X38_010321 [Prunus dulcis]|uniref:Reverse transcriptase Ty1/copia-type domain-containing protein n=1 Tax=Prunus dulcis TaxID=3755 RepID=A0AAD4WFZ7_PRUDU|nr:hypothetical protein L3X38_010321 [Prunus dulcis]